MACVLSLCLVAPLLAGSFVDAGVASSRGDYAKALRIYRSLAEQGDPSAQLAIGNMYYKGQGVTQDYAKAVVWFRKAAAWQYKTPERLDDLTTSLLSKEMAERSKITAQWALGTMHSEGQGVPREDAKAVALYRKAAEQGFNRAQYDLGAMYALGRGVVLDYVEAYKWISIAASRSNRDHFWSLRKLSDPAFYEKWRKRLARVQTAIAKKMTSTQIAEAQRLAREWKPKN